MTQPKHAVSTKVARGPLEPSKTTVLMKYQAVAPGRIVKVTLRDLAASSVPERALGRVSKALRVALVGCVALNDHSRSYLPAALGGTAAGLGADEDTLRLVDASFSRSPGRDVHFVGRQPQPCLCRANPRRLGACSAHRHGPRPPRP